MEAVEMRKKQREQKVYAKHVQAEKAKQKVAEKKANIEAVRQWRKKRKE